MAPSPTPMPAPEAVTNPQVVLVTGMSGAGRTAALKMLEDLGFEAVDNVPQSLIPSLIGSENKTPALLAICAHVGTRDFSAQTFIEQINHMSSTSRRTVRLLYLDCDDEELIRRYEETRHRHPLAGERPVADGIAIERSLTERLRERADLVLDTSGLKLSELKRILGGHFAPENASPLSVFVTSFAFRKGLPRDADLVFDVRFLKNPHYDAGLKPLSGRDRRVGDFIAGDPVFGPFFKGLTDLLTIVLPRYAAEGKSYLTIALGCTGGRHRSVFVAERISQWLETETQDRKAATIRLIHRDLEDPDTS